MQAYLHDGTTYDNGSARSDRVLWIDDGAPHVGIRSPWPGTTYDTEAQDIPVDIVGLNIELGPPGGSDPDVYHAKILYALEVPLDECLADECGLDYRGIVPSAADPMGPVSLPDASQGSASMVAVLADSTHAWFLPAGPVSDEIEIVRFDGV